MPDRTQLLDAPTCGAGSLDGASCDAPSTVMLSATPSPGSSLVIWRCDRHADDPAELARWFGPEPVTIEPINPPEPPPRPRLCLVPHACPSDRAPSRRPQRR
jgi:hypothetical protein